MFTINGRPVSDFTDAELTRLDTRPGADLFVDLGRPITGLLIDDPVAFDWSGRVLFRGAVTAHSETAICAETDLSGPDAAPRCVKGLGDGADHETCLSCVRVLDPFEWSPGQRVMIKTLRRHGTFAVRMVRQRIRPDRLRTTLGLCE